MRAAILGGGINGFCCGVQILEHFKNAGQVIEVTVISEAFTPNTTGDGSAGLWGPYLLGGTPTAKVHKWSKAMHDFLEKLWLSEDAGEAGVCLIPAIRVTTNEKPMDDFWKDIVYGFKDLTREELDKLCTNKSKKFTYGSHFITYTSEPLKLLPYLMKRFERQGGKIIQKKIENLQQFLSTTHYDIVVNCTGLGSRKIINDQKMYPVRGQVSRVKANWLYYAFLDESDDGNYIIPNTETTVLGGTHQENDYNTTVMPDDKNFIVNGCQQLIPALVHAQHLFDWVGLRPGRNVLRLETENIGNKIVIHNYGHGGSGVTISWGCADDVLQLLKEALEKRRITKSKL